MRFVRFLQIFEHEYYVIYTKFRTSILPYFHKFSNMNDYISIKFHKKTPHFGVIFIPGGGIGI